MKKHGIVISDIHVGAFDLTKLYEEYTNMFINFIRKKKKLDFVIIAGDFFDHKFYLNDKKSVMAYKMLTDLFDACRPHKAKIRIVYGTDSHECNQYDVLQILDTYDDIRVIKHVEEEELFEGMHVLYLPEEHILNKNEYYDEYLKKDGYYDYVFGHGIIRDIMKDAAVSIENRQKKNSKQLKVPVFTSAELEYCTKGQVFFGHYHINKCLDAKIHYCGSFSRWKFGEEEQKGFYSITCNNDVYEAKFIENEQARSFVTIGYGYDHKVFTDLNVMDETLSHVDELIKSNAMDHVRFEFNVPTDAENPESIIKYIKDRYKYNDSVKVEIAHGYAEKRREEKKEELKKDNELFSFVYDKSLSIEDKVHRCIELNRNKNIGIKYISLYLTKSVDEIINGFDDLDGGE